MAYRIYTDGSSFPGYKLGGWAYYLEWEGCGHFESGYVRCGDVNNAELYAVVRALETIPRSEGEVTIHTDSLFVIDASHRKERKWMTPLVMRYRELFKMYKITMIQVLRANRPIQHQLVHQLAREAIQREVQQNVNIGS